MNRLERQLLSFLDTLRENPAPDNVAEVRRAVLALHDQAAALDPTDLYEQGIRHLYDYVDASTRTAVDDPTGWLGGRRTEIENSLASILAAVRRGGSVYALSCVRDDLGRLEHHIETLHPTEREPLRCLLAYVQMKTRQALELAVRTDWGVPTGQRRLERDRPAPVGAAPSTHPRPWR
ncbi:hypothetical protein [Nocardia transvalensis]|uniref:hypothetical protein n=1 Tax=Nocardia transvalensis TaxID=37333 RepID=UPI00189445C1|nr:hypothetical protein [Nocardia transvalensis]MBF6328407.1 hypothetical protein [Nocardia transvalensis]